MAETLIFPYENRISHNDRELLYGHSRGLLWFTGLSGSGKSTIAHLLEAKLHSMGVHCYVLDGDNIRRGLNSDLGLSPEDRKENIRRTAEVSKILVDAGLLVISAFITPYEESRKFIRSLMTDLPYYECYIKCSLEVCKNRDPKGLYRLAAEKVITNMTGVSAPYEEPVQPDLVIESDKMTAEHGVRSLLDFLYDKKLVRRLGNNRTPGLSKKQTNDILISS